MCSSTFSTKRIFHVIFQHAPFSFPFLFLTLTATWSVIGYSSRLRNNWCRTFRRFRDSRSKIILADDITEVFQSTQAIIPNISVLVEKRAHSIWQLYSTDLCGSLPLLKGGWLTTLAQNRSFFTFALTAWRWRRLWAEPIGRASTPRSGPRSAAAHVPYHTIEVESGGGERGAEWGKTNKRDVGNNTWQHVKTVWYSGVRQTN